MTTMERRQNTTQTQGLRRQGGKAAEQGGRPGRRDTCIQDPRPFDHLRCHLGGRCWLPSCAAHNRKNRDVPFRSSRTGKQRHSSVILQPSHTRSASATWISRMDALLRDDRVSQHHPVSWICPRRARCIARGSEPGVHMGGMNKKDWCRMTATGNNEKTRTARRRKVAALEIISPSP